MKCFYHADLDGEASAAIVGFANQQCQEFVPMNYNDHFPIDDIGISETIYIVDFTLQEPGMWERLMAQTMNVLWIDHHESTILAARDRPESHLGGVRHFRGKAACELAWIHFNPKVAVPLGISLIGDFDTWEFVHGTLSRRFHQGLLVGYDTRPREGWDETWWPIVDADSQGKVGYHGKDETVPSRFIDEVCELGRRVLRKRSITNPIDLLADGFEVEFEGMSGVCINRGRAGSGFFDSLAHLYDVLISISFDGERWSVSLYHSSGNTSVHLGEIARRYGGSGHAGAAGFQCKELPFRILRRLGGPDLAPATDMESE